MKTVKESEIEKYLCERVRAAGGLAEKVQVIGARGFFDRLLALPGGRVIFCEVKKPRGGALSPHQILRLEMYRALGCRAVVVKSRDDVDRLLSG